MKIISAKDRRIDIDDSWYTRKSSHNIPDNANQCPAKMKARAGKLISRRKILLDAGLQEDRTFVSSKDQAAYLAKCDAAIEAAERGVL